MAAQVGFTTIPEASSSEGSSKTTSTDDTQSAKSVTVKLYIPAERLFIAEEVSPVDHK